MSAVAGFKFRSIGLSDLVRPEIKRFARRLRRRSTPAEAHLWTFLKRRGLAGLKFNRQRVLRGYIADFYCPRYRLVVEVDGPYHDRERDRYRDSVLARLGIKTMRFTNDEVLIETKQVLRQIAGNALLRHVQRITPFCGLSKREIRRGAPHVA